MVKGAELMTALTGAAGRPGTVAFAWLGQHGFALNMGGSLLFVDAFLTPLAGRLVAPLLEPEHLSGAAAVLGTHDHADHIDRRAWPAVARAAHRARFVVPDLLADRLAAELGIARDRFAGADEDRRVDVDGVSITGVPAAHEFLDRDPATGRHPYLGYLLRGNGVTLYHAGDTCLYEGLQSRLAAARPDVMFLPINGRDAVRYRRGCIGNMTYQEAADLAGAIRPGLVVPTHFDMFAGNTENPALFADFMAAKHPHVPVWTPVHGEVRKFPPVAG